MSFLESNAFWGIAGIIAGFLISTFFHALSKKRVRLEYQITSNELISEEMTKIQGIAVSMNTQPVRNLTSSTVRFYNAGNQIIELKDFAPSCPLSIGVSGQIFSSHERECGAADNQSTCPEIIYGKDFKKGNISFDFLKPKEFISFTVLHDGNLSVSGELKTGKIAHNGNAKNTSFDSLLLSISVMLLTLLGGVALILGLLIDDIMLFLLGLCLLIPMIIFYLNSVRHDANETTSHDK